MKITEREIIESARRLREQENQSMPVRPWNRRHFRVPDWLVALPAAVLVGFIAGVAVSKNLSDDEPTAALMATKTDTVYIQQPSASGAISDSLQPRIAADDDSASPESAALPTASARKRASAAALKASSATAKSMPSAAKATAKPRQTGADEAQRPTTSRPATASQPANASETDVRTGLPVSQDGIRYALLVANSH
ncbi:MAG: hypothetical protein IJV27_12005 [Prevotella sp.]|nr:hypothetical protein [Prevotella sp.]